jgi:hypothetical protein
MCGGLATSRWVGWSGGGVRAQSGVCMSRRVHLVCACVCARSACSERVYCWLLPVLNQSDGEFFLPFFFFAARAWCERSVGWVSRTRSEAVVGERRGGGGGVSVQALGGPPLPDICLSVGGQEIDGSQLDRYLFLFLPTFLSRLLLSCVYNTHTGILLSRHPRSAPSPLTHTYTSTPTATTSI